jgi:hypothetical protein
MYYPQANFLRASHLVPYLPPVLRDSSARDPVGGRQGAIYIVAKN